MADLGHIADPGGTGDYLSLNSLNVAQAQDLTDGDGDTYTATLISSDGSADTAQTDITGWVTDVDNFITIKADTGHEAGSTWNASKYRLDYNNWGYAITISEDYTVVYGLQIFNDNANGSGLILAAANCRIERCFAYGGGSTGNGFDAGANGVNIFVNCVAVGWNYRGFDSCNNIDEQYYYNCTAINNENGFRLREYETTQLKNCYSGGNNDEDYENGFGVSVWTTCYSSDGTGTTTTSACSTSSGVYFTNVTAGSEDVSINSAKSDLIDSGTNDPSGGLYSEDINGDARGHKWDVGADEYIVDWTSTDNVWSYGENHLITDAGACPESGDDIWVYGEDKLFYDYIAPTPPEEEEVGYAGAIRSRSIGSGIMSGIGGF